MTDTDPRITRLDDRSLLVLDDDNALRTRLGRALESRGFDVVTAASIAEAQAALGERVPAFAVLDMRLEDGNGLKIVEAIRERREDARIIMLTGYGAIATAVADRTTWGSAQAGSRRSSGTSNRSRNSVGTGRG